MNVVRKQVSFTEEFAKKLEELQEAGTNVSALLEDATRERLGMPPVDRAPIRARGRFQTREGPPEEKAT